MAIKPKETKPEHLNYLNGLRETGLTNMLGSGPYLAKRFGLPADIARDILVYWMEAHRPLHKKQGSNDP